MIDFFFFFFNNPAYKNEGCLDKTYLNPDTGDNTGHFPHYYSVMYYAQNKRLRDFG